MGAAGMSDFGRGERPQQNVGQMVSDTVKLWQALAAEAAHVAHAKRTIFVAYVAEGFTEAQALELVKNI